MSYTITITEVNPGVNVSANTSQVTITANTQPITVSYNAVELNGVGVASAVINNSGNLLITLSNSTVIDAGTVTSSNTYGNTTVAAYLATYSGSLANASDIVTLKANIVSLLSSVAGANAAIVTANTAVKDYVDAQITTTQGQITTANTAMKSYVDAQTGAVTTAWTTANTTQSGQITTLQANVGSFYTWANTNFGTSSYANANVTAYLPTYSGSLANASDIVSLKANTGGLYNSIVGANAAIVTANTAMKGYVDAVTTAWTTANTTQSNQITALQSSVAGANTAITTANTAMKGYVDAVTTAWTSNAAAQASQLAGANAAIVSANTALKSYVDGQITTTQSWVTGANAAIVTANVALKGYVDQQFTNLTNGAPAILDTLGEIATSLGNNASLSTTLLNSIAGSNAAIVTANTALKNYVDTQDSATTTAWTANAAAQAGQITGANAVVATLQANVGSFYTWANTNFGTSSYSNANVTSYLPVYAGNIAANAVTRAGVAWQFNTDGSESFPSATTVTTAAGKLWYNGSDGTWNAGMGGGNITQQIGEEIFVYGKASGAITDTPLQLIYKTGTVGASGVITFAPTIAGITDDNLILGCATEDIALNAFGRITAYGIIHGITTTGSVYGETWTDDQDIYYNPATGGLTKTKPTAPNLKLFIGTVINAGSGGSGSFYVKVGANGSLNSLSDVQLGTNTGGQVLSYSSASGYWKNTSLSAGTGVDITTYTNGNITIAGTYSNANVTSYLPTYSGSLAASSDIIALYANAGAQSNQIAGANAAIVTANTAMKSYVDAVTTAWTSNAATQQGQIDAKVNTSSLATVATTGSYTDLTNTPATYGNTQVGQYLTGVVTVGNIASTSGYFWANGTAYSTGSGGSSFTGDLVNYAVTASTAGRVLANAYPQSNVTQISTYTQGIGVTGVPSYTSGNLNAGNYAVAFVSSGNVNYLTSWSAGTRTTIGSLGYLGVTATSANTAMNPSDRVRALAGGLDINLNGKTWGTMSTASGAVSPVAANGQTLNVYGTGNLGQGIAIAAAATITPVAGSANVQYLTGYNASLSYSTAGATYTTSNIQYARLLTGGVTAAANLTVANAIMVHTPSGWVSSNVSLINNAYALLNEDTRTIIQTAGNIVSTGTGNKYGTLQTFNEQVTALGSTSGTITANLALGSIHTVTATGDITINTNNITNAVSGSSFTIVITQDGTGSRLLTSNLKYLGGTKTLSTTAGSIDVISGFYDGTNYLVSLAKGFA